MKAVDLRSDTVTRPSPDMLRAMMEAEVGDVVFDDDPTVHRLEAYGADLFGKEAALFVPTGSMANQIGLGLHVGGGDAVLLEERAHLRCWEGAAASAFWGAHLVTVPSADGLPTVEALEERLFPNPKRAKALEAAAEQAGHLYPAQAWPDLKLIGCWLGGSAGIQARQLAQFYGEDVPLRDIGYRATEGTMTIPIADETAAGALACASNFYEFIPVDHIDDDDPPVLLAHEIEEGERYYILLTNHAGLYRYDINDVIEVQGFWRNAPLVAFIQKGRDMVSITGEKLHVNQILEATRRATESSGVEWTQVQLVPDVEGARYDFLLEPKQAGTEQASLEQFIQHFDTQLGECNMEYRGKRKSKRLRLPRLFVMRPGWSERIWRADVVGNGKRDAQYKWPFIRLSWDERNREDVVQTIDLDGGEGLLRGDD